MVTVQTRVTESLKIQADALFKDMGLTTTDAVRMFLMQCINRGGLLFTPTGKRPNTHIQSSYTVYQTNNFDSFVSGSTIFLQHNAFPEMALTYLLL